MKSLFRLLILPVIASIMMLSAGVAMAQTPTATATPTPESHVNGSITALDQTAKTVTITPKDGSAVTVKVVAATKITKTGAKDATINDLAVNDRAEANYNSSTMEASRINAGYPLGKHHGYVGTIKSISASNLVLTTKKSDDVTLNISFETKYRVPGLKDATQADFKVGDRVDVLGAELKSGGVLALHIHKVPGKPMNVLRTGTIDSYTAGSSITLKNKKGETSTFVINSDTKIRFMRGATEVKVGEKATVAARRDPASDQYVAKQILVAGESKAQGPKK